MQAAVLKSAKACQIETFKLSLCASVKRQLSLHVIASEGDELIEVQPSSKGIPSLYPRITENPAVCEAMC